jgi:hypothetical protein
MAENASTNLSRDNDFLKNEGVKMFAGSEVLSRKANSKLPVYNLRRQQRFGNRFKQEIVGKFYDSIKDVFFSFDGVIQSKSEHGLSFITQRPLEVETPVLIRRKTPLNICSKDSVDEGKHAQVISCRKVRDQNDGVRYRISIEFF